ncbi:MAG: polyprenyl synthetase family protein [Flavobacteriaceae bacterium]|nr:polyprenyl synthetase family protein [Flavobacteriaceae bacterium]
MAELNQLSEDFNQYLSKKIEVKDPVNLYQPIKYILDLGGKRIRPLLVLLATDLFESDYKNAFPAALAVEVFHNFTLIHDDIMDSASLRRGKPTVHHKWNENIGILSGDAMLIQAYSFIEEYPDDIYRKIMKVFNKTAMEVCEGQQYDMDFEQLQDVSINQYLDMIKLKTSVLLASAFEIGAIIANASDNDRKNIYNFGLNLGLAFQIQDDYLDTFGDEKSFGKKIGGDIIENKKTFLYLMALQNSNSEDQLLLKALYKNDDDIAKIKNVSQFFKDKQIPDLTQKSIELYTNEAFSFVDKLSLSSEKKEILKNLGLNLMNRSV